MKLSYNPISMTKEELLEEISEIEQLGDKITPIKALRLIELKNALNTISRAQRL